MRSTIARVSLLALGFAGSATAQRDTAFSWSKTLPAGARFSIRNLNGLIDVRPSSSDKVEVRATIRVESRAVSDVTFDVRETGSDVEICTVDRGMSLCIPGETFGSDTHPSVRYIVDVPKGLRLYMQTGSGDVLVMQTGSEVNASTGAGDVVIRESETTARANSGSGNVTVAMANGRVYAHSGNGDVVVNTFVGPVEVSSGNGNVDVRMITVDRSPDLPTMSITSGNGNIKVTLPADFNGRVDASNARGKVESGFSGRGGPVIRVNSGNGKVEIRKE
jgi:hypothetical protein